MSQGQIISESEAQIVGFQYMDRQIGPEVHLRSGRDITLPFNKVPMPGDPARLDKYRFKRVRITVEIIDDETEDRCSP